MQHCIFDCKLQNKESSFKLGWPKSRFYCFLRIGCDLRRAFVVRRKCAHLSVLVCSFGKGDLIMTRGFYLPHMQSKQVMSPLRELQSLWGLAVSQKLDINQKSLFLSNKIPMNEWGHSSRLKYLIKSNSFFFIVIILPLGAYRQCKSISCKLWFCFGFCSSSFRSRLMLQYIRPVIDHVSVSFFIYHCSDWL